MENWSRELPPQRVQHNSRRRQPPPSQARITLAQHLFNDLLSPRHAAKGRLVFFFPRCGRGLSDEAGREKQVGCLLCMLQERLLLLEQQLLGSSAFGCRARIPRLPAAALAWRPSLGSVAQACGGEGRAGAMTGSRALG